jgi:hypothetical protein
VAFDDHQLTDLAARLVEVPGVVAVLLGGSRARRSPFTVKLDIRSAGCFFRVVVLCAHALHGHAGRWLINEKGAIDSAGSLANAPREFAERAHGLLGRLGGSVDDLNAALDAGSVLVRDTVEKCGPSWA